MNNYPILKKLKKKVKIFLFHYSNWYSGKYINIHLQGGLCNKLHCLISACDLAIKKDAILIEPYFGWERKILFSEIYDMDYFNFKMGEFSNGKMLMVSRENLNDRTIKDKSFDNVIDLWEYSEKQVYKQRNSYRLNRSNIKLKVLSALKLKVEYEKIVSFYTFKRKFTALQIRIESDWEKHAEINKPSNKDEKIIVPLKDILTMLSEFNIDGELFFTTGQNHKEISENLETIGLKPDYFYDPLYEYELNAAINFEICCKAENFIGLSRSTYSNLITLKRAVILNNDKSYIYNYRNKIIRRKDKGIQVAGETAINKTTLVE